ncbi:carbon-nitrogen hydrolase family protein [Nakamurella lactea]|uniref:carbon-nitrogen hydrolase family protein n=1 Tax=Nakamurella lactea TaxID=459515 RepID=UPI000429865A|nr:carbon-nitrogen hydrolase family protein [Nakamurella lactea]
MRIAIAQFEPTDDPAANGATLAELAQRAADGGARLMLAPEGSITDFLTDPAATVRNAQPLDGPFVTSLVEASGRLGIAVVAGTFVPTDTAGKVTNTLVIADRGELRGTYRKIHLYDAFSFQESDTVEAGSQAPPVLEFDGISIGFATCYDLRYPELFRVLRSAGADVLALASAWVVGPGKEEHWLTLLRARAIENTTYVIASDQVGRKGIGRSAAFDPFGLPLLDLGTAEPAVGFVDVDPSRVAAVRKMLPSGENIRFDINTVPRA